MGKPTGLTKIASPDSIWQHYQPLMNDEEKTLSTEENPETRNENPDALRQAQGETGEGENSKSVKDHSEVDVHGTQEQPLAEATAISEAFPHRNIKPGMVVRVHEVIKDLNAKGEERERVQMFEGTVLALNSSGIGRTMTVRKVSDGVGVEKIYPLASPHVRDIEVLKQYRVRRAKLWYLKRDKKKRRLKEIPLEQ